MWNDCEMGAGEGETECDPLGKEQSLARLGPS